jgi:hypothetical protein
MRDTKIYCNNIPRLIIDAYQLTAKERAEFDYLDWQAIDNGEDSADFFRYKGSLYHLGDVMYINPKELPSDSVLKGWDGYCGDSFFSGVLVRYTKDIEQVIVGRYCC